MTKEQIWKAIEAYQVACENEEIWARRDQLDAALDDMFNTIEALQARVAELESGPLGKKYYEQMSYELQDERDAIASELASIKNQKPCAVIPRCSLIGAEDCDCSVVGPCKTLTNVYLAPTTPVREPLSEERIKEITGASDVYWAHSKLFILGIARAIEAAIKEQK